MQRSLRMQVLLALILLSHSQAWDAVTYRSIFLEAVDRSSMIKPLQIHGKTAESRLLDLHKNRGSILKELRQKEITRPRKIAPIIQKIESIRERFKRFKSTRERSRLYAELAFYICALADPASQYIDPGQANNQQPMVSYDNWVSSNLDIHAILRQTPSPTQTPETGPRLVELWDENIKFHKKIGGISEFITQFDSRKSREEERIRQTLGLVMLGLRQAWIQAKVSQKTSPIFEVIWASLLFLICFFFTLKHGGFFAGSMDSRKDS